MGRGCTLEHLPQGKKALGSQWVYKTKFLSNSDVECLKSRLVVFGNHQQEVQINFLVYVDALINSSNNSDTMTVFKANLCDCFKMKDLGPSKYFLGIEVARSASGLLLCQRKLVGRLIYLSVTRSDLVYSVHVLSQFMQEPLIEHWEASLRVGWCDSDWAECPLTRRSLTSWLVFFGHSPISWKTKKQPIVSISSAEAEYRSMNSITNELKWLKALLLSLGVQHPKEIQLFCDSQYALHFTKNPVFHERTKHIEINCHIVRDAITEGLIASSYISTSSQLADIFTKALGKTQFYHLLSKLGIFYPHAPT
ncbi:uncharacterized protein LOC110713581 [Chenopodium quinoa]|uniref:uncharacterized protein LOC110713581 n=1 Tax=Chenopodium quinoa TaxID=63459 RepID=UPI000B789E6B|nr:uncharacterized protein LOC110713581 [Chenopodium quinoa]